MHHGSGKNFIHCVWLWPSSSMSWPWPPGEGFHMHCMYICYGWYIYSWGTGICSLYTLSFICFVVLITNNQEEYVRTCIFDPAWYTGIHTPFDFLCSHCLARWHTQASLSLPKGNLTDFDWFLTDLTMNWILVCCRYVLSVTGTGVSSSPFYRAEVSIGVWLFTTVSMRRGAHLA